MMEDVLETGHLKDEDEVEADLSWYQVLTKCIGWIWRNWIYFCCQWAPACYSTDGQVMVSTESSEWTEEDFRSDGQSVWRDPTIDFNLIQHEHRRSSIYHLYSKKDTKWVKIIVDLCPSPFGAWSRRKKAPHMNWRPCFLQPGGNDASLGHGTHMDPPNH